MYHRNLLTMKKVLHKAGEVTWLMVEVPEGAVNFSIGKRAYDLHFFDSRGYHQLIELPKPKTWQLIGLADSIGEEVWKEIVENHPNLGYKKYDVSFGEKYERGWTANWGYGTATASGLALLKSHGMQPSNCVLLKQVTKN